MHHSFCSFKAPLNLSHAYTAPSAPLAPRRGAAPLNLPHTLTQPPPLRSPPGGGLIQFVPHFMLTQINSYSLISCFW